MRQQDGQGVLNILAAEQLMQSPRLYATFLLWMLSELFQQLPEAGDLDKPKIAFFFDEAHLLFKDAPDALLDKIEQVVRLIRSKGVGIYFVTQNPLDIPDSVLGQLGNRVQHALRAFTPRDQKAVKAAASTMRPNPGLDIEAAITELAVGEALVSLLDEQGRPGITQRALICPPESQVGPIDAAERHHLIQASPLQARYAQSIDRESAYERLHGRTAEKSSATEQVSNTASGSHGNDRSTDRSNDANTDPNTSTASSGAQPGGVMDSLGELLLGSTGPRGAHRDGLLQTAAKSAVRAMASQAGREILRGVLGGLMGSSRRKR
jgi:DNA helicase HerA-like ATPase